MKKFQRVIAILIATLILCCLLCGCNNRSQNSGRVINSVNHRGYNTVAPENTLAAFRLSKQMGFTAVECDVSFTKDGIPVLLHDQTVDRTSNGKGKIRDLTYQEVSQLDFGSWKSQDYKGEQIPTFSQFVELCVQLHLHPYVEIKSGVTSQEVALLAEIVANANLDVTWICFEFAPLQQLADVFPNGRFGFLVNLLTRDTVNKVLQLKTETNDVFVDCNFNSVTDVQVKMCMEQGVPLEIWTPNNPNYVANIHPYISGVTSDIVNATQLFATLD